MKSTTTQCYAVAQQIHQYTNYWWRNPARQLDPDKSKHTFKSGYGRFLKRLLTTTKDSGKRSVDGDAILHTVLSYPPKTDSRKRAVNCLHDFAVFNQIQLPEHFRSYGHGYTAGSVEDREIPSDDEIIQVYHSIEDQKFKNAYALQATYGLRNHEVHQLHWDFFKKNQAVRTDQKTKTGERLVFPIPKDWIDLFNIHPDMELPGLLDIDCYRYKGRNKPTNKNYGFIMTYHFMMNEIKFNPYDLRHAYALRTIQKGLQPAIASQLMGHSLQIHSQVYHRHIQVSQLESALSSL